MKRVKVVYPIRVVITFKSRAPWGVDSKLDIASSRGERKERIVTIRIERGTAKGTNLMDQNAPVVRVYGLGNPILLTEASLMCLPHKSVNAVEATDEEIIWALTNDEHVYS